MEIYDAPESALRAIERSAAFANQFPFPTYGPHPVYHSIFYFTFETNFRHDINRPYINKGICLCRFHDKFY